MNRLLRVIIASTFAAFTAASAHAQHFDILIARDGNNLVTGAADVNTSTYTIGHRVFEGELDGPFGSVYIKDEPGFFAVAQASLPSGYSALPGSTAVRFNIKSFEIDGDEANLWYWDGLGGVDFDPVAPGTQLTVWKSPFGSFNRTADGSAVDVAGFTIDTTGAGGTLHKHLNFDIEDTGGIDPPAAGYYLAFFTVSMTGLTDSEIFAIVWGAGAHDEEAHEAAVAFVDGLFSAEVVPEPASLTLLGVAGSALLLRRRRNA